MVKMARFISMIAVACVAAAAALPASAQIGQQRGPIDITADSTEFVDRDRMARWVGRVDVRQGDARLLADRLDVYFAEGPDGQPGEVVRLVADGSVAYITPEETARGDRGVYSIDTDQIVLTGNVTLLRGRDTLVGHELIVEPSVGRSRLVSTDERVRAVIYPEEGAGAGGGQTGENADDADENG